MSEQRAISVVVAELGILSAKHEALCYDMFKHAKLPQAATK